MKPKPLYRSITFWSGLLVMGFICWTWWYSMRFQVHASWGRSSSITAYGHLGWLYSPSILPQNFSYSVDFSGPASPGEPSSFGWPALLKGLNYDTSSLPELPDGAWSFADHMERSFALSSGLDARMLILPHWLLLLAVAVPWVGLLLWRMKAWKSDPAANLDG